MAMQVECPSCGQKLKVPDNLAGKKVRCSKCQGTFMAGAPEPPPPPVEDRFTADEPEGDYEERPARRKKRRRDEDDFAPERGAGNPGRGGMVMSFGIISIVLFAVSLIVGFGGSFIIPFAGFCIPVFDIIGLVLGILAWTMGSGDLKKIRAGRISRSAEGNTRVGFVTGIIGTVLNALSLLCGCVMVIVGLIFGAAVLGLAGAAASMQTNKTANPPFGPPPGPRRPFQFAPTKLSDYMPRIDPQTR
jgi:predicted Zn finger-like uncharacterized protein